VSFDKVVRAMKQTGRDLSNNYKETSEGGLAFFYSEQFQPIKDNLPTIN